ncbi:trihelix transcription factor ENAP1-like isoform X2 [Diospyros lotus]|uniref:trihelix transcription factor ENAP1-like isoform X2 n=1 Tax=Diospyros lotus TaxID=55363 RepID=UPI0022575E5A|nr:trihelix transcription factor ENAP1-like isoform X2 [Diospyros lotus]
METGGEEKREVVVAVTKTLDKSKRDEWSEGAVMSLLDVYEAKWLFRNRAKLKGSDWEDVARQVSARDCGTKLVKNPNQCKNKIEAMKKRYRMESAVNNHSGSCQSWQFYARMDKLMKGALPLQPKVGDAGTNEVVEMGSLQAFPNLSGYLGNDTKKVDNNGPAAPTHAEFIENKACNYEKIGVHGQGHVRGSNQDDGSHTAPYNSEFGRPQNQTANVSERLLKINSLKRRKTMGSDVAESIRMLSRSVLKVEQARIEMYKDSERLRAEAEIKRAELDLKRTEIIAKTQLQIAKLFVKRVHNHNNISGKSSFVAEHIVTTTAKDKNG